ncbi:uncharacterized protein LOC119777045 [Cyprinodon tularosa]|uniref:uncharacterized protein LOC119777045 n=1 Tax=Cyprinodon tularosa TaxID=77115 RepID=UPI0018E26590|nr:uncharacterized protein LOC119777045 [Cyprinodon tularosa]
MDTPEAAENPDNEYMAMDADQWEEPDDTYENGDIDIDIRRRDGLPAPGGVPANMGPQQSIQTQNSATSPRLPVHDRYMTIRWPPLNANRGSGKSQQPELLQKIVLGLILVCLLLLMLLIILAIFYGILGEKNSKVTEKSDRLEDKIKKLQEEMEKRKVFKTIYSISSSTETDWESATVLYVLNHYVLENHMNKNSFTLHYSNLYNESCYTWNCTC